MPVSDTKQIPAREANFDGLVGPTHNYGGLAYGNVASSKNRSATSHPREAALQGLRKMKHLADRGLLQGVLPPHERPHLPTLRRLGFSGSDKEVLGAAVRHSPELVAAVSSAACMFTANSATVAPHWDTTDGRTHFTPANLVANFHRSFEAELNGRALAKIFPVSEGFSHAAALPSVAHFGDEGAANHTRLSARHGSPGLHLFVYGRKAFAGGPVPTRFPARQTLEASQAVARLNALAEERTFFLQQAPGAIDAGAFHNDVVAVGNERVLLYHEQAFLDGEREVAALDERFRRLTGLGLVLVRADSARVSLDDAIQSYLFNGQLLSLPEGGMGLVLPREAEENPAVKRFVDETVASSDNPIREASYFDLRQSMQNGGGPACLRLRVPLADTEVAKVLPSVWIDDALFATLNDWVTRHYRESLEPKDLADPLLLDETRTALDELTRLLNLGPLYDFQR